jgi:hypothetical protein
MPPCVANLTESSISLKTMIRVPIAGILPALWQRNPATEKGMQGGFREQEGKKGLVGRNQARK